MINLWSFLCFDSNSNLFALTMVSAVLSVTSESISPTDADKCGAHCWPYQLSAPKSPLSGVFSRSVISSLVCFRRPALGHISLTLSGYCCWDKWYEPSSCFSIRTPHWVNFPSTNSPHVNRVWIRFSRANHSGYLGFPQNKKSSTCPAMIPLKTPFCFHNQQQGSDQDFTKPSSFKVFRHSKIPFRRGVH